MLPGEIINQIKNLILPLLEKKGLDLIDITYHYQKRSRPILSIIIDTPTGGITLDECSCINEEISQILDREDLLREGYILEVSSPGVDRPLSSIKDFNRVMGKRLKIFLKDKIKGRNEIVGILTKIEQDCLRIELDRETLFIPVDKIIKAKQFI